MNIVRISSLAALAPLWLLATGAQAAIYRCAQPDGSILYSDYACNGGAVVDVRPGSVDPHAQERLARAQAELDRAAADRRAREQFDAMQREEMRRAAEAMQRGAAPAFGTNESGPGASYDYYAPVATYAAADRFRAGTHRVFSKTRETQRRVPQVIRTPHPHR